MDIDIEKLGPFVIPALITVVTFWWFNLREHARRLQIIDLATKRVAFWDQFLKVAIAATAPDSDEQKQSKGRAFRAIQRVHSDAERELERLVWRQNIRQPIGYVFPTFEFPESKLPSWHKKISWLSYIILSWLGLLSALLLAGLYIVATFRGPLSLTNSVQIFILMLGLIIVSGWARWSAEMLKYPPRPSPPILNEI